MVIVQLFLLQMDILGLLLHLMDIVSYHIQLVWMICIFRSIPVHIPVAYKA